MTRSACAITARSGEDGDSNEAANKGEIEDDPQPTQPLWCSSLQDKLEDHRYEGVRDGGSKNAFDSAIGGGGSATNGVNDLVYSGGEETKRDDGGQKLKNTKDALDYVVGAYAIIQVKMLAILAVVEFVLHVGC